MNQTELEELKKVDIRTVDVSVLEDIEKIEINRSLSVKKRWEDFTNKIKNPFCFVCNGVIIKVSYSKTKEDFENKLVQLCINMEREYLEL